MTGNPLRFSETPIALSATAPAVGEHTLEVLLEAGYSEGEVAELMQKAIIA
jgi:crotonobetainyl-CoA:carnitine CoA-transferase CaiB-like acyl-CoA transferase